MENKNLVPTIKHIAKKLGVKPTQMSIHQKDLSDKTVYVLDIKSELFTGCQIKNLYNLMVTKVARNVIICQENELYLTARVFI